MFRYFQTLLNAGQVINSWTSKPTVARFLTTANQMDKPKVLVTREDIPKSALSILEEK